MPVTFRNKQTLRLNMKLNKKLITPMNKNRIKLFFTKSTLLNLFLFYALVILFILFCIIAKETIPNPKAERRTYKTESSEDED